METAGEKVRRLVGQAVNAVGGMNALGRMIGINASSVLAWTRGEALPGLDKVPVLAVLLREDRNQLRATLVEALEDRAVNRRATPRPTMGTTDRSVVPSPKSNAARKNGNARRRRKLAVVVLGLASGLWSLSPQPAAASRPDKIPSQAASASRDSVAYGRKRAA